GSAPAASTEASSADQDLDIAADISNLTGASTKEVSELRATGLSWNEVLGRLKGQDGGTKAQREERSTLLTETGMEEIVVKLRDMGYEEEKLQAAKMLAERVEFQLDEIVRGIGTIQPAVPVPGADHKDNAQQEAVQHIGERYEAGLALYYMMLLQEELGSSEAVLDEYLLALQLDLDLADRIRDRKTYDEAKEKAIGLLAPGDIVTVSRLEEMMLDKLRPVDASTDATAPTDTGAAGVEVGQQAGQPQQDSLLPEVPDVKPVNPGERVRAELDALNPNLP
uniref:hypothetical protein n=1 Tax=Paenibacillus kobensis TaxID=59841 RepID=UPI0013E35BA6